ncbi:MAG TPA: hypothetical protein VL977_01860 [Solirubrobacteraceae bacterium]|nr:hypothetical protein [Solirubrobacteraceae bacterium]
MQQPPPPGASAILTRTLELIAARSPAIATPILDSALGAGTITRAEHAALLAELVGVPSSAGGPARDVVERLRHQIRAAIRRAAPVLARPLLDQAVAERRLTPAQEVRILRRLRAGVPLPVSSAV